MPIYEYQCESCGQRIEVMQRMADGPPETCEQCGEGPFKKLVSAPAFQFKGSGWYVTDYARKGEGKGQESGDGDAKGGDAGGGDTKGSDAGESDTKKSKSSEGSGNKSSDTKSSGSSGGSGDSKGAGGSKSSDSSSKASSS